MLKSGLAEPTAIATVPTAIKKHLGAKRQKNRSRENAFALDFCLELGFRANDEKIVKIWDNRSIKPLLQSIF